MNVKSLSFSLFLGLSCSLVLSCGKTSFSNNGEKRSAADLDAESAAAKAESLEIVPATLKLKIGEKHQFKAEAGFTDQSTGDVSTMVDWSSADKDIGVIDNKDNPGEFTAVALGKVTIGAKYDDDLEANAVVTVVEDAAAVTSLVLSYQPQMLVNETQKISVKAIFSDATSRDVSSVATFKARKSGVLLCQPGAVVKGLAGGTDVVDVEYASAKAEATIEVVAKKIVSLTIVPATKTMAVGEEAQFSVFGTYDQGGDTIDLSSQAQWTSLDSAKLGVANNAGNKGRAQAKAAGSTAIRATYNTLSVTASVTINDLAVTSLSILPVNPTLKPGDSLAMRAYATYADGSTTEVTGSAAWVSQRTNIAVFSTVTKNFITAKAAGDSLITATFKGKSGTSTLHVVNNAPTCVAFSASKTSVFVGDTVNLDVTPGGNVSSVTIANTVLFAAPYRKSVVMTSAGDFTYDAHVDGPGGVADCSPVQVTVNTPPIPPAVCNFAADKATYSPGEQVKLTVTGTNITSANIAGQADNASPFQVFVNAPLTSGQKTYSATAFNVAGAPTTCSDVTIAVAAPPSCTATPHKSSYTYGEAVQLNISGSNIASASLGAQTDNAAPFVLSMTAPSVTGAASYTVDVKNSTGAASSCVATINVVAPGASCTVTPNKSNYTYGEAVQLSVSGANIASARLDSQIDASAPFVLNTTAPLVSGNKSYTVNVTNLDGALASCMTSIAVASPLATCTLTSDKPSYTYGEQMRLSLVGSYISSAKIANVQVNAAPFAVDVIAPSSTGTASYQADAWNADGVKATCTALAVTISAPEPSCSLSAENSSVDLGQTFNLVANVNNASKVIIDGTTYNGPFTSPIALKKLMTADVVGKKYFSASVFPLGSTTARACPPQVAVDYVPPACVAGTDASIISFENSDIVGTKVDKQSISNQYQAFGPGVTFSLEGPGTNPGETPILTRVLYQFTDGNGKQKCPAFNSATMTTSWKAADDYRLLNDNCLPNQTEGLGTWVLSMENAYARISASKPLPVLVIRYNKAVAAAGGYLVDVDRGERWTVTAYNSASAVVGSWTTTAPDDDKDGKNRYWEIKSSKLDIVTIKVVGVNTKPRGVLGFAFDKFSASAPICGAVP